MEAIDLFGGTFNLRFSSTTGTFQTKLGGHLTVLLGIIFLGFLVNITLQYLDTKSPIVTTSTELNSRDHVFNLYEEDLYLQLVLSNAFGFIEDYERFATPKLRVYNMIFNAPRKTYDIKMIKEFDYVRCSKIKDSKILGIMNLTHPSKEIQALSLCPDFAGSEDEFTISDDLKTNSYRRAELTLYPCSLEDQTKCAKAEEFLRFRVYFGRMNKLLTSANYEKPVTLSPTISDITLNTHFSKLMKFAVFHNKIVDRKYEFFAPKTKEEYSSFEVIERDVNPRSPGQIHCTKRQVGLWIRGGCAEYLSVVYEVKREVFIVRRNYKRITDVFGQFGGIMKLMTAVVFFLYSWYNEAKIRSSIIAATFGFDQNDEKEVEKFINSTQRNNQANRAGVKGEALCCDPKCRFNDQPKNPQNVDKELIFIENGGDRPRPQPFPKKSKKKIIEQKKSKFEKFDQVLGQLAEKRMNVNDLMSKLNFLDFLEKIFLDENLKKLLPMVLLKAEIDKKQPDNQLQVDIGSSNRQELDLKKAGAVEHQLENSLQNGQEPGDADDEEAEPPNFSIRQREISSQTIPSRNYALTVNEKRGNNTIWPKRLQTKSEPQPKSLKSAYYSLKASEIENCTVRANLKSYVVRQIGAFFENQDFDPPDQLGEGRNHQFSQLPQLVDPRSSFRAIRPPQSDLRMSETFQKKGVDGLRGGTKIKNRPFSRGINRNVIGRLLAHNPKFKKAKKRVMGLNSSKSQNESWQNFLD